MISFIIHFIDFLLGSTLRENSCPTIHIQGETQMFSAYDVDDKYVVFYTDCRNPLEQQALLDGDKKVMPLCEDIKKLLAEDS